MAKDSEVGLGGAVWTQDLAQAYRVSEAIEAGICWVNTHHRNDPSSPWGGIKSSGVGSENGLGKCLLFSWIAVCGSIVGLADREHRCVSRVHDYEEHHHQLCYRGR